MNGTSLKNSLLAGFLCFFITGLSAQQISESEFARRMDRGELLMKEGRYEEAQEEFLFIINNKEVLPSNIAYFFGRNSYHIGEFKQSINWLNKYIQLKGTGGLYYNEAVSFLESAENEYMKIQRALSSATSQQLTNDDYDCGGLDKMICPVCKGSGVLIKQGPIDKYYQTCPYCEGNSYLSCEDYNLFMRGRLQPGN
jgi:tetratricopeptide (TPR) repeat protein